MVQSIQNTHDRYPMAHLLGRGKATSYGFNSLAPGSNFKMIIFKLIIENSGLGIRCEIILRWMT